MYGSWFSIRLSEEGHNVDIYLDLKKVSNKNIKYCLDGLIKQPLLELPDITKYDFILFA